MSKEVKKMGSHDIIPELERGYIEKVLRKGKRIDGRSLEDFREITIEPNVIKRAEASARVTLGETRVLIGIKISAGPPYPDTPDAGVITVNAELLPLASARFESGPPSDFAIEVARVCDRGIRHSNIIDKKDLCMIEGQKVFVVFGDIYAISFDGNLFDSGEIALTTALNTLKIPEYEIVEEGDTKEVKFLDSWKKVPVNDVPVSVTIGKIGDILFVDPTEKEELALDVRMTFTFNKNDELISLQKGLNGSITKDEVNRAFDMALGKTEMLRNKILESIKDF
ncbi:MAG: exosome complex protein Rrp42 [Candidatus Lokiarchaeota archaeon]|nr:exosome complex protein Rrp42 [Candidatus Lokiarchaeota archaeon]